MTKLRTGAALLLLALAACATPPATPPAPPPPAPVAQPAPEQPNFTESGRASWYGREQRGFKTASGERFDPRKLTAAHRTLPMGTVVRVTASSGETVKVRINDRGPHVRSRIIDLSEAAAHELHIRDDGVIEVKVEVFASDQK